jgi:hypothetical protein
MTYVKLIFLKKTQKDPSSAIERLIQVVSTGLLYLIKKDINITMTELKRLRSCNLIHKELVNL